MDSRARFRCELTGFYSPVADRRHLVLLAWLVTALLLSQPVLFDRGNARLPMAHCLAGQLAAALSALVGQQLH